MTALQPNTSLINPVNIAKLRAYLFPETQPTYIK